MPDERELFEDASRGDLTAVEELLGRHLPGLVAFVRGRWDGLPADRESASDLVQSVCRDVLERLDEERLEYRGEAEFRAWLHEAALFKIKDRHKFWRAERRDARRDAAEGEPGVPHSVDSPSRAAVRREEQADARALLAQLPERYRRVVELAKLEGLEHQEIAQRMEITEGASRMLLSRALARLATLAGQR